MFPGSYGFALLLMDAPSSLRPANPSIFSSLNTRGVLLSWTFWGYGTCGSVIGIAIIGIFVSHGGFLAVGLFALIENMPSLRDSTILPPASKLQQQ